MKKISFYLSLAFAGLLSTACTGDYTDWAQPQSNPQEEAITIPGVTASAATDTSIVLANAEAGVVQLLTVSDTALPAGTNVDKIRIIVTPEEGVSGEARTIWATDATGLFEVSDLQEAVTEYYGMRPTERKLNCHTYLSVTLDGQATYVDAGTFQVLLTPIAPVLETAYYITGSLNGWDNSDTTYKLENGGADPYENPVFTVLLPATEDGSSIEFKVTPESGLGGDWSQCLAAGAEAGKFVFENAGGNIVIAADPDALFYRLEFNLLDQTYKVTSVGFADYIYEIGNESGWAENNPLHGNGNGQYEAVIYLNGEFKFKPNKDNWDGDWEKASGDALAGTLTVDGKSNVDAVEAGFYYVVVDLKEMTYKLTPVTTISIIGPAGIDWNNDVDLTYNEALKCWEAHTALKADEFKFRANHDWAINWGGSESDLTQGGDNLKVAAEGNYIVRLYLSDEAPAYCTIREDLGFPDNIYEIGNESGWGTSHLLPGNGKGQYTGFYYLNGEFKFKPNADNWDGDFEKVSGDAYAGTLSDQGAGNIDAPEAGFYKIDVNLDAMTYALTAITSVSIIGNGGDWNTDIELAYNTESACWEITTELAAGEFKFRANHDWAINWGGSFDNLSQDGSNLSVAEAGTYKVQLFLSYAGAHHCTLAKQ